MKKLLLFAVVLLSGCSSVLSKYPRYDVAEPSDKAKLYIDVSKDHVADSKSKRVQRAWREYFVPASAPEADFVLTLEKQEAEADSPGWVLLSFLTAGIIPAVDISHLTYSFSLTDVSSGTVVQLSDIHIKYRNYIGWLMIPALLSSNVRFNSSKEEVAEIVASAIGEAASLIYNPNSRLYKKERKKAVPVAPAAKKEPVSEPVPAAPVQQKPVDQEDLDMLW